MNKSLPISLCIIMKNEERFIEAAVKSAKSVMGLGDLVVVDTGSTDKSKEIAAVNGARVFDFEWIDDFSAAKNFAAEQAKFDWVFSLDADEEIREADIDALETFIKNESVVGSATRLEMENDSHNPKAVLYNRKIHGFTGSIHEQVTPLDPKYAYPVIETLPVLIAHHGYLPEHDKVNEKLLRNEKMLLKELAKNPNDPYLLYQLGKSFFCNSRNLAKACEYFEQALRHSPNLQFEYVYNLVECYGYALVNSGQYKNALEFLDKYEKNYDDKPQFRFLAAHILVNNGIFSEALEYFESCIGAECQDFMGITSYLSYYNIGIILDAAGMKEAAAKFYANCGDYKPAKERLAST